ncbi:MULTISPECIES: hypothetical protein [unclassified Bartonella]
MIQKRPLFYVETAAAIRLSGLTPEYARAAEFVQSTPLCGALLRE